MKEFKGTKGNFSNGQTGWKIDERNTNGVKGYEIHWSDDGECVTDHVYTLEDAQIISASPDLLFTLQMARMSLIEHGFTDKSSTIKSIDKAINKALGL
jgi:hypothetical protein